MTDTVLARVQVEGDSLRERAAALLEYACEAESHWLREISRFPAEKKADALQLLKALHDGECIVHAPTLHTYSLKDNRHIVGARDALASLKVVARRAAYAEIIAHASDDDLYCGWDFLDAHFTEIE